MNAPLGSGDLNGASKCEQGFLWGGSSQRRVESQSRKGTMKREYDGRAKKPGEAEVWGLSVAVAGVGVQVVLGPLGQHRSLGCSLCVGRFLPILFFFF